MDVLAPAAGPDGCPDHLLDGLTEAQRRAVTIDAAPLCVVASAGAGKTRVLTRRIAYRVARGDADAAHVMVITFTRKAAGELTVRLGQLGLREQVQAGTFHAIASAQLRRWWADRGVREPALLDRKARILAPLSATRPGIAGIPLAELAGHIEWAKARMISPAAFPAAADAAGRRLRMPADAMAALYQRYEDDKRRRGLIDFDDLLARCADAFQQDAAFAAAQRWRWRHLFVDEFQDVNPLQFTLLAAWLGDRSDLCVVGDPDQAIYSWNGADPSVLNNFTRHFPGGTVVRLAHNHRCSPQIVATAAAVLGPAGTGLAASGPDGPPPSIRSYATDEDEARQVCCAILDEHATGTPWREMAVLVRTNAQAEVFCEALTARGVPHRAPGRASLLDDPAVADLVREWRTIARRPAQMAAADLQAALAAPATGVAPPEDTTAALQALLGLLRSFEHFEGTGSVGDFLTWVRAAGGDRPGADDAVTVCSFHRSKGLEWRAVWVCGLEAGLVPNAKATSAAALAEEQRLLYVALTRAGVRLDCSWAATRRFGSRPVPRSPSPWLEAMAGAGAVGDLPASPRHSATVLDAAAWRARLHEQRQRLRTEHPQRSGARRRNDQVRLPDPDHATLAALHEWRARQARATGVPAHVVLHDRTLEALAALRPSTPDALTDVPGMGPIKAARLGPTLLPLLDSHAATSA